jgi:hypothetical protein
LTFVVLLQGALPGWAQEGDLPPASDRARAVYGGGAPEAGGAGRSDADLEQTGRAVAERLGVEFLSARQTEREGRQLIEVRVMQPGGNSNTAFLVSTLLVDPATGEVTGVFPTVAGTTGAGSGEAATAGSGSGF